MKIILGLEHVFHEDVIRELELFILEKRKLWRPDSKVQYLKRAYKKMGFYTGRKL